MSGNINEKKPVITIRFDGEEIAANGFVKKIFAETILAMAGTLRGYDDGMDVGIEIKFE